MMAMNRAAELPGLPDAYRVLMLQTKDSATAPP